MKRKLIAFSIIFFSLFSVYGQITLSKKSEISVLTCSPGNELYAAFGHSAIRVLDIENNIDWVFNYGTFDFKTPNFYGKFIKGQLNYILSIESFKSFESSYNQDKRYVSEQVLNLDSLKKQQLFDFLIWNAKDENKYYLYDFFWDNCATRIRDVLTKIYGDSLIYPVKEYNISFRDMIDSYLKDSPWTHFGINIALGLPADSLVNTYYVQFLPDYMDTVFTNCYLKNETPIPLVKERNVLVNSEIPYNQGIEKYLNPKSVFWFLFILFGLLTFYEFKKKKRFYAIDTILLFIFGFIGLFVSFLWFGTEHRGANYNLNIMWALPTHFIVAIILLFNKKSNFVQKYLFITGIYTLIFLPFWNIFPQRFDTALIPLFLIVGLRFTLLYLTRQKQ